MLWPPNTIKPVRFAKPERLDFFLKVNQIMESTCVFGLQNQCFKIFHFLLINEPLFK